MNNWYSFLGLPAIFFILFEYIFKLNHSVTCIVTTVTYIQLFSWQWIPWMQHSWLQWYHTSHTQTHLCCCEYSSCEVSARAVRLVTFLHRFPLCLFRLSPTQIQKEEGHVKRRVCQRKSVLVRENSVWFSLSGTFHESRLQPLVPDRIPLHPPKMLFRITNIHALRISFKIHHLIH